MGVLTLPLALIGLAGLPLVAAIYILRSRSRRHHVSSLMLWADQRRASQGGRTIQRMEVPLLLVLELLAVALLTLGAAGPRILRPDSRGRLVVVLDDSYSMQAGARDRCGNTLGGVVGEGRFRSVQFIVAGANPRVLASEGVEPDKAVAALASWTPRAPEADLDRAIALAGAIGGPWAKILVLTDKPPPVEPGGLIKWVALGRSMPNAAIVNAIRSWRDGADRCLIELANLSDQPASIDLAAEGTTQSGGRIELAARERRRVVLDATAGPKPVRVSLGSDALATDNEAILLPPDTRPVRVQLLLEDPALLRLMERACSSAGLATLTSDLPELIVTDSPAAHPTGGAWMLHVQPGAEPAALVGPFVIDHNHPLAEGLSLEGVIWGSGTGEDGGNRWVISAGNDPLLSCRELTGGTQELWLSFAPGQSNLQDTPNWPILTANLLSWRRASSQRLSACNARLGQTVNVRPIAGTATVRLTQPDGSTQDLPVRGQWVAIGADQVGLHRIDAGSEPLSLSVSALSQDESDLSGCGSGAWGDWQTEQSLLGEYVSISWIFLLACAAVMTTHGVLVWRLGRGGRA